MWSASVSFEVKGLLLNVLKREVKTWVCEKDSPTMQTKDLRTSQQLWGAQSNGCVYAPELATMTWGHTELLHCKPLHTSAPSSCNYSGSTQASFGGRDKFPTPSCWCSPASHPEQCPVLIAGVWYSILHIGGTEYKVAPKIVVSETQTGSVFSDETTR